MQLDNLDALLHASQEMDAAKAAALQAAQRSIQHLQVHRCCLRWMLRP